MLRLIASLFLLSATIAHAEGRVILTIDNAKNEDPAITYTLEALDAFTQTEVVTNNEFVDGEEAFSGPLARDILDKIGATDADDVRFVAFNEYEVVIEAQDFYEYDVILATRMNNEVLPRRTKGPIWLIYPISDNPELQDARVNAKLIWQVTKIEVR